MESLDVRLIPRVSEVRYSPFADAFRIEQLPCTARALLSLNGNEVPDA